MWTVLLSVIAYVYGFFLTALFFSKALNIRYSAKKTAILTGIFIALLCILKLPGLYKGVNANVNILMILQAVLLILYMLLVYRGTIVQTILAMILNMLSLAVAESLTMYLLRMGGIYEWYQPFHGKVKSYIKNNEVIGFDDLVERFLFQAKKIMENN